MLRLLCRFNESHPVYCQLRRPKRGPQGGGEARSPAEKGHGTVGNAISENELPLPLSRCPRDMLTSARPSRQAQGRKETKCHLPICYLRRMGSGKGLPWIFWKIILLLDIVCFRTLLLIFSANITLFLNLLFSSVLGRESQHLSCKSLLYASM